MRTINKQVPLRPGTSDGFTLVEVLVAIFVMSIGLLGLAGLQSQGTKLNHSAYLRTQAVLQIHDLADRMRANITGVNAGDYNSAPSPYSLPATLTTNCAGTDCDAASLASYDLTVWQKANDVLLPNGAGTITNNGNGTFTVAVSWNEEFARDQALAAGLNLTRTVTMEVIP